MSSNPTDVVYGVNEHIAHITINRPDVYNAFRAQTCEELIASVRGGIVGSLSRGGGARRRGRSCVLYGGDQKSHAEAGAGYGGRGTIGLPIEHLHTAIRDCPKPVIARVQGFAIGGGNVLAAMCDLTIASEKAVFGQVGPKMGSVDPGYGTAYLARIVGEKKAREMWYLCRDTPRPRRWRWGWSTRWCRRKARRGSGALVRGADAAQPHGHLHREEIVQRRFGTSARNWRARHAIRRALLRHRRIEGRRQRAAGKTPAAILRVRRRKRTRSAVRVRLRRAALHHIGNLQPFGQRHLGLAHFVFARLLEAGELNLFVDESRQRGAREVLGAERAAVAFSRVPKYHCPFMANTRSERK